MSTGNGTKFANPVESRLSRGAIASNAFDDTRGLAA